MGLSLSVLVALFFILPGATFVFGLTRLHSPNSPQTPLDQHLSIGLAIAIGAALMFQSAWISLWIFISDNVGGPKPEATQFIALLSGDLKTPLAKAALYSTQEFPLRIALYFASLSLIAWYTGKQFNRRWIKRPLASWFDLLKPANADFVWLTADMHLDGRCYLFAGPVEEFSIARDGSLERVVLEYAVRKPLDGPEEEEGFKLKDGWTEVPGEFVVLQMRDVKVINLDYIYPDT